MMDCGPLVTAQPWLTNTSTSCDYADNLVDRINDFWDKRGRDANARVEMESFEWVVRSDMVNGIAPLRGAR